MTALLELGDSTRTTVAEDGTVWTLHRATYTPARASGPARAEVHGYVWESVGEWAEQVTDERRAPALFGADWKERLGQHLRPVDARHAPIGVCAYYLDNLVRGDQEVAA